MKNKSQSDEQAIVKELADFREFIESIHSRGSDTIDRNFIKDLDEWHAMLTKMVQEGIESNKEYLNVLSELRKESLKLIINKTMNALETDMLPKPDNILAKVASITDEKILFTIRESLITIKELKKRKESSQNRIRAAESYRTKPIDENEFNRLKTHIKQHISTVRLTQSKKDLSTRISDFKKVYSIRTTLHESYINFLYEKLDKSNEYNYKQFKKYCMRITNPIDELQQSIEEFEANLEKHWKGLIDSIDKHIFLSPNSQIETEPKNAEETLQSSIMTIEDMLEDTRLMIEEDMFEDTWLMTEEDKSREASIIKREEDMLKASMQIIESKGVSENTVSKINADFQLQNDKVNDRLRMRVETKRIHKKANAAELDTQQEIMKIINARGNDSKELKNNLRAYINDTHEAKSPLPRANFIQLIKKLCENTGVGRSSTTAGYLIKGLNTSRNGDMLKDYLGLKSEKLTHSSLQAGLNENVSSAFNSNKSQKDKHNYFMPRNLWEQAKQASSPSEVKNLAL